MSSPLHDWQIPGAWGRPGPQFVKPLSAAGVGWEPPSPPERCLLWVLEGLHRQGWLQPQGTSKRVVLPSTT